MRSPYSALLVAVLTSLALRGAPSLALQAETTQPAASDWERAVAAIGAGRFEDAAVAARLAVATHPEHAGSHFLLGSALLRLDRVDEAVASLEEACRLAPEEPHYVLALATAQLKSNDGAALVPLEALLRRLSTEEGALTDDERGSFARLLARAALDSPAKAVGVLERGVAGLPEQSVLRLALAEAYRREGEPERAYDTLVLAHHHDPGDRKAGEKALHLARSRATEESEDEIRLAWWRRTAEAADLLLETVADDPTLRASAEAWLAAGEPTIAATRLQAATRIAGEDADLLYRLARCALAEEDTAAAERYLVAALDAQPEEELEPRIQRALATLYHRRGAYDRAAEAYRRAGMSEEADALAELATARRECLDLGARLHALLDASEASATSPERRAIEAELEATRVTCADVLAPPLP